MPSMKSVNIVYETRDDLCFIHDNVLVLRDMLAKLANEPKAQGDSLEHITDIVLTEIARLDMMIMWSDNSFKLEYLPTYEELSHVHRMMETFEEKILDMEGDYDDFDVKTFSPEYFHRTMQKVINGASNYIVLLENYIKTNHQEDVLV